MLSFNNDSYKNVSAKQCVDLINSEKDLLILDVRIEEDYKKDHIKGAISIPLSKLGFSLDEILDYEDSKIIVYCTAGSKSIQACEILGDNGFEYLYNMIGGYGAWQSIDGDKLLK